MLFMCEGLYTVRITSLDPFYMVIYHLKWIKTLQTDCKNLQMFQITSLNSLFLIHIREKCVALYKFASIWLCWPRFSQFFTYPTNLKK